MADGIAERALGAAVGSAPAAWRDVVQTALPPEGFDAAAFARAFASAARHLGQGSVPAESAQLGARTADELGRVALLVVAAGRLDAGRCEGLVDESYARGDSREKAAVLRALPSLPEPKRFVRIAVDACRTNERSLFEAIACDNPFPAAHFPEPAFNQMALKAVFVGAPVGRISGLEARRTPELDRMADDYASERRAAGRPVPADVALLKNRSDTR